MAIDTIACAKLCTRTYGPIGQPLPVEVFCVNTLYAIVYDDGDTIYTAVRGTDTPLDHLTNTDVRQVAHGPFGESGALWHEAWLDEARLLYKQVSWYSRFHGRRCVLCGHSRGGAVAAIAAARLVERGTVVDGLVTFGCPRFCNPAAASIMADRIPEIQRWVKCRDIVPRVPPAKVGSWRYRHVGECLYINTVGKLVAGASGCYRAMDWLTGQASDPIQDHSMDGYLNAVQAVFA